MATVTTVVLVLCTALAVVGYSDEVNPLTRRPYNQLVGALVGECDSFDRWYSTFTEYLTASVDPALNLTFELTCVKDFGEMLDVAVPSRSVDLVFSSPNTLACVQRGVETRALVSPLKLQKVGNTTHELSEYFGAIVVQTNSTITEIPDLSGRSAATLLGDGLVIWNHLLQRGVDMLSDLQQLQFARSTERILLDVVAGVVDAGLVRADALSRALEEGLLPRGALRVLEDRSDPTDPVAYPLPHSTTRSSPEFILAALPWVDWAIQREVVEALFAITPDMPVARAAGYTRWVSPGSVGKVLELQNIMGVTNEEYKCLPPTEDGVCSVLVCSPGTVKKTCPAIMSGCAAQGIPCPQGAFCMCQPCEELPETRFTITLEALTTTQNPTAPLSSDTMQCSKMTPCLEMEQGHMMQATVTDGWFNFAASDSSRPDAIEFKNDAQIDGSLSSWTPVPEVPGTGEFVLNFTHIAVGAHLMQVRRCTNSTQEGEGAQPQRCEELDVSPLLYLVQQRICPGAHEVPRGDGTCVCVGGFERPKGSPLGECTAAGGGSRAVIGDATALGVAASAVVVVAAVALSIRHWRHQRDLKLWAVSQAELHFPDPPVILGRGTFGQVLKGEYRGTGVAVKRVLPPSNTGGSEVTTASRSMRSTEQPNSHTSTKARDSILETDIAGIKTLVLEHHGNKASDLQLYDKRASRLQRVSVAEDVRRKSSGSESMWNSGNTPMTVPAGGLLPRSIKRCMDNGDKGHRRYERALEKEMRALVHLRHPNIVTTMGAVMGDAKQPPLMIMEIMKRGSLYDLLDNFTVQFNSSIAMELLNGIVTGMIYLHSTNPPILHNDLKAANVLVGVDFQAKLADFGLSMKKKSKGFLGTPYWMAPELFKQGAKPTVKTDVYSFGITVFELFTRSEPYTEHTDPAHVLKVLLQNSPDELMRPALPSKLPGCVRDLIVRCWDYDPEKRPTFDQIKAIVDTFDLDDIDSWLLHQQNFKSQWTSLPHAQATDEEWLVALADVSLTRNRRSNRENSLKSSLDVNVDLLNQVFPKHIANQLKRGKKVAPEEHECVTIFFSDIVGFTDISQQLDAMGVMDMLDRLYRRLDALCLHHGLFKVDESRTMNPSGGDPSRAAIHHESRQDAVPDHDATFLRRSYE